MAEHAHRITIRVTDADLKRAKAEFPSTCPDREPHEWTKMDFIRALAALHHRDFEIREYHREGGR
jgi:hypothetical protein